ncbi:TPA: plasmid stabilization protein StbC [Pseudomonas putida]
MERQPTREEVLFEWFLGDSKDIVRDLKSAVAGAEEIRDSIIAEGAKLGAQTDDMRAELIEAHRQLAGLVESLESNHQKMVRSVEATATSLLAATQRRSILISAACAVIGGLAGALAVIALVPGS